MATRYSFGGDEHVFVEVSEEMSLEAFSGSEHDRKVQPAITLEVDRARGQSGVPAPGESTAMIRGPGKIAPE